MPSESSYNKAEVSISVLPATSADAVAVAGIDFCSKGGGFKYFFILNSRPLMLKRY